jgi:flagellar hook protein FlgE
VTVDGRPVQGYTALDPVTGKILTTGQPNSIVIPPGVLRAPVASTLFGMTSNLDSRAANGATFAASVQIYDALGDPHVGTVTFTKTAVGTWSYAVTVPGAEVTGGTPGSPFSVGTGTVAFDNLGKLQNVNGAAPADVSLVSPPWKNGAKPTNFSWDLVDANGVAGLTQYAAASATASVTQNGAPTGSVSGIISVNEDGELMASFGTGRSVVVGQLALATFNDPQGLVKGGTNYYSQSEASGNPSVGVAGTGGRGSLIGSALEQSNVDIAQEFTQMILAQRGYQANSKSITVADELLLETLNLKR